MKQTVDILHLLHAILPTDEPVLHPDSTNQQMEEISDILKIEGIGERYANKLKEIKIDSVEELLTSGSTVKSRKEIVDKTGISDHLVLTWVNHADLFRIKGIGEVYAELLEAAGVDTVPELAQRSPENLHLKLVEIYEKKKRVRQLPGQKQVEDWVDQAKKLPRVVNY